MERRVIRRVLISRQWPCDNHAAVLTQNRSTTHCMLVRIPPSASFQIVVVRNTDPLRKRQTNVNTRVAPKTVALIGVGAEFAALIRCLGEFYRLKYTLGPALTIARIEPFVLGSLVTAIFLLGAVLSYFWSRYILAACFSAVNVLILFWLRFAMF